MKLSELKIKTLDRYIIGKFLGTYFFTISMLVIIVIIFDFSEKMEDFIELNASFKSIALDYYLNFIPFFINQFSGLITFISVILFTSKLAYQTEIIAILASGVSFKRFLYPYFLSALMITIFSLALNMYIIPNANVARVNFESKYLKKNVRNQYDDYIYRQVDPGTFVQIKGYSKKYNKAEFLVISTYNKGEIVSMLSAQRVIFNDKNNHWTADKYIQRTFVDGVESLVEKKPLDTLVNLTVEELGKIKLLVATLDKNELNDFILEQQAKGADNLSMLYVEKHNRIAYPISTLILTLIGVSLSSRKIRGGTGFHISIGILLCFSYILFMKFGNEYAKASSEWVELSVWMPNILYAFIAYYLYIKAPK